ncbi:hypothetical protein BD626DRAFT_518901 [Schizophyllum amplum]|uniref:MYND-type domain-containing protein n=1 Tax=Schizophyllum amplum TaxID=97359 RepID=A0A550BVL1_9AGAR|nr:hypothetical protein BD626DRAFT_518901 [Auriculariopsis ampla]
MHWSSLKELTEVLARLQEIAQAKPQAERSRGIRSLIKDALRLLKSDVMEIVLRDPPRTSLVGFTLTNDALCIVSALFAFVVLSNLVNLGYRELWVLPEPEDAVWPRVLQWTGYLLPLNHGLNFSSFTPSSMIPKALDATLCVFDRLGDLPPERARSIVLSGGHNAIHDIVTLWLNGPALIGEIKDSEGEIRLARCCDLLHTVWPVLGKDDEMRAILIVYISRAVKGNTRRLFRTISSHIDALAKQLKSETWTDMDRLLWPATVLAVLPELHGSGFPRCTVRSAITVLRIAINDCTELCQTAHDFLGKLCYHDSRALLIALDHGLFATIVELRATGTCEHTAMSGMAGYISFALSSPSAVRRFHNGLPNDYQNSGRSYHPDDQALLDLANERFTLLEMFDEVWCYLVKCANAKCTSSPSAGLRACPCGEALYCSRTCQRADWNARHKTSCALEFVHGEIVPLKPRDVHFLRFLSHAYLRENHARFVTELKGPPIVTLDLSMRPRCDELQTFSFNTPDMQGGAIVKALYRERTILRSRMFTFYPSQNAEDWQDSDRSENEQDRRMD